MWQSIVKVAYKPEFSASFKKFIRDNVSPEFINIDGEGYQFFVPAIEDQVDQATQRGEEFKVHNLKILKALLDQRIEYVEL